MAQALDNKTLNSFLLGTLPEAQREELEMRFFEQDEQFELLLAAEDDLIDAYVRGSLSSADRKAFETHFLTTPERRQRVQFARTLHTHVEANQPVAEVKNPWWKTIFSFSPTAQLAIAAAAVLLVVLVTRQFNTVNQPAPVQQAQTQQQPQVAPPQEVTPAQELPKAPIQSVLAFALTPGLTRDAEGAKTLAIPAVTRTVQLQLNLESADFPRYQVAVQTPEGQDIWKQSGLRSKGKSVFVDVPAAVLAPRDYVVKVIGVPETGSPEDVAEYAFRTARR